VRNLLLALMVSIAAAGDGKDGVELVYRMEFDGSGQTQKEVISILRKRLKRLPANAGVVLEPFDGKFFTVRTRTREKKLVDRIKRLVSEQGKLRFRITVEKDDEGFDRALKLFRAARAKGVGLDKASRIKAAALSKADRMLYPHGLQWRRLGSKADENLKKRAARADDGSHWMLLERDAHDLSASDLYEVSARRGETLFKDWVIAFSVRERAQARMAALTKDRNDEYMAIVLDDRVIWAPVLRTQLRTTGMISGGYDEASARTLAAILAAGALEKKPVLVSERAIAAKR
jgi:preprotein translocase subunit SecD